MYACLCVPEGERKKRVIERVRETVIGESVCLGLVGVCVGGVQAKSED